MQSSLTLLGRTATPSQLVACARTYLGTPYHDYGRIKGLAADCIGLPIMVGKELGLFDTVPPRYSTTPRGRGLEMNAEGLLGVPQWVSPGWGTPDHNPRSEGPLSVCAEGCLGLFWFSHRQEPTHFAIFGKHPDLGHPTMIHANARMGAVCEQSVDAFWTKRMVKVYRLPGVLY